MKLKMKKVIIAVILIETLAIVFLGYKLLNPIEKKDKSNEIKNLVQEDNIEFEEYSIVDLENTFGKHSIRTGLVLDMLDYRKNYFIRDINYINSIFTIQLYKKRKPGLSYSVYKVKEGGYYYIFYGTDYDEQELYITEKYYMNKFKTEKDFESIKEGNTIYDVLEIEPQIIFGNHYGSGPKSFNILDDDKVLMISYEFKIKIVDGKEVYYVKNKEVYDRKDTYILGSILDEDMPSRLDERLKTQME